MEDKNELAFISLGERETPDFESLIGSKKTNFKKKVNLKALPPDDFSNGLIPQDESCHSLTNILTQVSILDVEISNSTNDLYNYSNRNSEIEILMESITEIGQQQPIIVVQKDEKYIVIDGVLRLKAMERLEINVIKALITDFVPSKEFSLSDFIIHHQIQKVKTEDEKLNEIKTILRVGCEDYNSTKDREKRVQLVSKLLGVSGWRRNNVYMLEKVLIYENHSDLELNMGKKMIANELSPAKAIEALEIIKTAQVIKEKENETKVMEGFLSKKYDKDKALNLLGSYEQKKTESVTSVPLHPIKSDKYTILKGNVETIDLPSELRVDTIFTSPPYYHIVHYGEDVNELGWESTPDEYITRLANIIMKCYDKLKDTGSVFINLGDTYINGQSMAIPERLTMELIKRGLNYIDRIIWNKASSNKPISNSIHRLMPSYELILHFSKSKKMYFEKIKLKSDKVLKVARGCKEKHNKKISYHIPNNYDQIRSVIDNNIVESIPGVMLIKNIITLEQNKARTKHTEDEEHHPATFSQSLPVIPLLMSCPKNKDTVVFDPFMGSGSCGVTALLMGLQFVGVELYEENIKSASRLLSSIEKEYDENALNLLIGENPNEQKTNSLSKNGLRTLVETISKQAA